MAGVSSVWTIRRSTSDVKVAGLCGGIARQWGVDPVLVRVGFALLALSGGVGLVLYLAGWLLLPADGRDTAPVDDLFGAAARKWPREVWIAIVFIACVAAFALFGSVSPFGIGPALVIAVIWYFGFYRPRAAQRDSGGAGPPAPPVVPAAPSQPFRYPGPPTPFTEAAEAWQRRVAEHQRWQAPPPPGQPGQWPAPPPGNLGAVPMAAPVAPAGPAFPVAAADPEPFERAAFLATPDPVGLYSEPAANTSGSSVVRPRRRPSARRLGWAALLVLGLTLSGLGLADYLGATITPAVYAATALLVIGLALVLATWFGRARGLLPVGVVLALGALGLSAGPTLPGLPPSMTTTHLAYTTPAQLPAGGDRRDVGALTVDLSRLPVRTDIAYAARVDLGTVEVIVPRDTQVVVRYRVDGGSVTAFGRPVASGSELSGALTDPNPLRANRPTLTLDLAADLGTVEVRR
jgi:phage shock protein PspC (stress-responsive transcriptional regulator)